MRTTLKRMMAAALALGLGAATIGARAAERELDYAAQDAAYQAIKQLSKLEIPTTGVAFLGLFGPDRDLASVFRAGLLRYPGAYQFYTRNEKEWNVLISEIEFGDRREDVMDKGTIQEFGQVKGVETLLYGEVREATVDADGTGVVRVVLSAADVETGEILWSGMIEGKYETAVAPPEVSKQLREAAIAAGSEAAEKLTANADKLADAKVYLLPLQGRSDQTAGISDIVLTELVQADVDSVEFFKPRVDAGDMRIVNRIAAELTGEDGIGDSVRQFARIQKQLDQLYEQEDAVAPEDSEPKYAVLVAKVTELKDADGNASVALTLEIQDLGNQMQSLWAANVRGEVEKGKIDDIKDEALGLLTVRNIAIAVGALVALVIIWRFMRLMTRAR
jgi:hypothetical protein